MSCFDHSSEKVVEKLRLLSEFHNQNQLEVQYSWKSVAASK